MMIIWAKITKAGNSAANWFRQQITYKNKLSNCTIVYPYGFHANATANDSLALVFAVGCNAENKAAIAYNPNIRPNLSEGEVAVYSPSTSTEIILNRDGDVRINSKKDVLIDSSNQVTVNCIDCTINATNSANITALVSVDITAPIINLNGAVNVSGTATFAGAILSGGKDIGGAHNHPYTWTGSPGSGDTGAPN